jgi:hypothetical protein
MRRKSYREKSDTASYADLFLVISCERDSAITRDSALQCSYVLHLHTRWYIAGTGEWTTPVPRVDRAVRRRRAALLAATHFFFLVRTRPFLGTHMPRSAWPSPPPGSGHGGKGGERKRPLATEKRSRSARPLLGSRQSGAGRSMGRVPAAASSSK